MTRECAVTEINDYAEQLDLSFEDAALECICQYFEGAGISADRVKAECGCLNTEQLIEAYRKVYSE